MCWAKMTGEGVSEEQVTDTAAKCTRPVAAAHNDPPLDAGISIEPMLYRMSKLGVTLGCAVIKCLRACFNLTINTSYTQAIRLLAPIKTADSLTRTSHVCAPLVCRNNIV
jgi:hypothetical protein